MRTSIRWALTAGAAAVAITASSAVASAQPGQLHRMKPNPGLGDDIYFYHPIIQSVPQTAPLETLVRFRTEVFTNYVPQAFETVMHLMWWHRGRWFEILPTVRYNLADLPALQQHFYLSPADWVCHTGRLYVRVHVYGITHEGRPDSNNLFFPWAGFNRKHLGRGNVRKPPSLHQAWQTSCQGHDTLIG